MATVAMVLGISGAAVRKLSDRAKQGDRNAQNQLRQAGRKAKNMIMRDPRGTHRRAKQAAKAVARARAQKAAWQAKQAVKRARMKKHRSAGARCLRVPDPSHALEPQKAAWRAKQAAKRARMKNIGRWGRGAKKMGGGMQRAGLPTGFAAHIGQLKRSQAKQALKKKQFKFRFKRAGRNQRVGGF